MIRNLVVCVRERDAEGHHGPCHTLTFERPDAHARRLLARFTCDQHGRPIVIVPPGSFPALPVAS